MAKRVVSPSGQKDFFCDDDGAKSIIALYQRDRGVTLTAQEQDAILFDFGGSCFVHEPQKTFEIPGLRCVTPITQFAFVLDALRRAQEYKGSGSVAFGGWMGFYYVISLTGRGLLVREMSNLWLTVKDEAEAWEQKTIDGIKPHPNLMTIRPRISDIKEG